MGVLCDRILVATPLFIAMYFTPAPIPVRPLAREGFCHPQSPPVACISSGMGCIGSGYSLSSTLRFMKLSSRFINFCPNYTAFSMIIDQSHGLHEGIGGGRFDKFPAPLFQVFRQGNRFRGCGHALRLHLLTCIRLVAPKKVRQRSFLFYKLLSASRC